MDCQTAEGMVSSYIEHKLPVNELEEFLDHVQDCSSCYDELEEEIKLVFGRGGDLSSDRCTCGNIGLCNDGNNSYHMRYWRIL